MVPYLAENGSLDSRRMDAMRARQSYLRRLPVLPHEPDDSHGDRVELSRALRPHPTASAFDDLILHVLFLGSQEETVRVDAGAHVALMEDIYAIGYRALVDDPTGAMSRRLRLAVQGDDAIPTFRGRSFPEPAGGCLANPVHQPIRQGTGSGPLTTPAAAITTGRGAFENRWLDEELRVADKTDALDLIRPLAVAFRGNIFVHGKDTLSRDEPGALTRRPAFSMG